MTSVFALGMQAMRSFFFGLGLSRLRLSLVCTTGDLDTIEKCTVQ